MNRPFALAATLGIALLALVFYRVDLGLVWQRLGELRPWHLGALIGVYLIGRIGGILSWLLTIPSVAVTPRWLARLCRAQAIGEAVERLTPLAGLGGEPVKAAILKRDYGVRIRDTTTSVVLTKTTDLLAIIAFGGIGMALLSTSPHLPAPVRGTAMGTLALCTAFALGLFAMQRGRALSRVLPWLAKRWPHRFADNKEATLDGLLEIENQLVAFYSQQPWRFAGSVAATFAEWLAEAYLIWLLFTFLDVPASAADAVCIAAFALLVRSTLFFVPGDIGTHEAALVVVCGSVVGAPPLGLVVAAVVRAAELTFLVVGFAIGMPTAAAIRRGEKVMR